MKPHTLAAIIAVAASVMAVYGLAGSSKLSGPVIIDLSETHGVHRDDLLIAVSWIACLWAAITLWRR